MGALLPLPRREGLRARPELVEEPVLTQSKGMGAFLPLPWRERIEVSVTLPDRNSGFTPGGLHATLFPHHESRCIPGREAPRRRRDSHALSGTRPGARQGAVLRHLRHGRACIHVRRAPAGHGHGPRVLRDHRLGGRRRHQVARGRQGGRRRRNGPGRKPAQLQGAPLQLQGRWASTPSPCAPTPSSS